jgi:D-psicose/D-tagatose/L-ribulose 3-epimerase
MRVSISNIAWKNDEEAAVAALLQEKGITGVDVAYTKFWASPTDANPEALRKYRQFWSSQGVQIIGMQSLIYGRPDLMLFGDPAVREQMAQYLREVLHLAGQLGACPLVFGSPKNRLKGNLPEAEAIDIAAAFFASLMQVAQYENVILCIEPNPAQYSCDFIRTATSALELVKRVNHPHFRLHLDAAIMTMNGEDIEPALEGAAEVLAHFHVSEPQLGVVGEGTVDHRRFAAALRHIGYQGWVAIEMRSGWKSPDINAVSAALDYTLKAYGD